MTQVRSTAPAVDRPARRPAAPHGGGRGWLVARHLTAGQRARRPARLDRLGAAVETPMHGLFLARLRAGPP